MRSTDLDAGPKAVRLINVRFGGKVDIDSCAQKRLTSRNSRASILFIFSPFFRDIPHLMKHIERKGRHPLLLVGAQSLVQRLPRSGEFLEVG